MPGNTFGKLFKITTWGESHGKALGTIIDGCPPGISLSKEDIQSEVDKRKPKDPKISTPRKETDKVEILSGVIEGKTTGMPISVIVFNKNKRPRDYKNLKDVFRPGHADLTYEMKYGIRDYRGGGRASGRETVSRVIAGAVAKKILEKYKTRIIGHAVQIGPYRATKTVLKEINNNIVKCGDAEVAQEMIQHIKNVRNEGDSVGGIVEIIVKKPQLGLGEPVFDKIDADLSKALMSIGGVKGISFGDGFKVAERRGSEHNDELIMKNGKICTVANHAGGVLGGITTGEDLIIHIAVKPPSSIAKKQQTVDNKGRKRFIEIIGRHDACIVPRLIPVAESMVAITLVDHLLRQKAIS
jgi:chorismate synthase